MNVIANHKVFFIKGLCRIFADSFDCLQEMIGLSVEMSFL